ncbi:hypothetical protein NWP96_03970 [Mycoplasmopsis cynos]|nr:hypothetical protein [Mycoplasmopsis cynos]
MAKSYDENVIKKIDDFRNEIKEFIPKLKEAKVKFEELKQTHPNSLKISEFEQKLNNIVIITSKNNEYGATNFITEINNYLNEYNDQINKINEIVDKIPYIDPGSH